MKILVWNIKRCGSKSGSWEIINTHNPDVCLLQEVSSIPSFISNQFQVIEEHPTTKNLEKQKFKSVILIRNGVKYTTPNFTFSTKTSENIYQYFKGNLLGITTETFTFINVYSPPWAISDSLFDWKDIYDLKLKSNSKLFITEILYDLIRSTSFPNNLIFGGDFNSSIKFDFGRKNSGNQEIISRLHQLDYFDSLSEFNGGLVPTFQNPRGKEIIHQLDYLYIHKNQIENIQSCNLVNKRLIIGKKISDHLPILLEING